MPGFDWDAYLKGIGVGGKIDSVIVSQPRYLAALDKLLETTPLPVWKAYFEFHMLSSFAPHLSQPTR